MRSACPRAPFSLVPVALAILAGLVASPQAQADHYDRLLAPKSVCPNQLKDRISSDRMERSMRCMHNYARRKVGRGRLRLRSSLLSSAAAKAGDILQCEEFSHDACGRDAFYWLREFLYIVGGCYTVAENISLGSGYKGDVRYTMSGWLHSDGHRHSLLNSSFNSIGLGVVRGPYKGYDVRVWVAHFGDLC